MKKIIALAVASLAVAHSASAVDLEWNGFGSAFGAKALSTDLQPNNFPNKHVNFTNFSLFGLNVVGKIDEHFSAAAQLVATGKTGGAYTNYAVQTEWGYINYAVGQGTSLRVGRQRYPIFTASEFINEHWQLPFRELPAIVYRAAPFTTFDGLSISHAFDTGVGKLNLAVFGGTPLADVAATSTVSISANNLFGVRANLEGEGWRVRAQASRANEYLAITPQIMYIPNQQVFTLGYRYDKNNIVTWAEYLYRQSKNSTISTYGPALRLAKAGYVLAGYRIGDWMPRYTFAQATMNFGFQKPGTTTTHTVGLNYQASPKVIVKAEWELNKVKDAGTGYGVTQPAGSTGTSGSAVYAGFDYAF